MEMFRRPSDNLRVEMSRMTDNYLVNSAIKVYFMAEEVKNVSDYIVFLMLNSVQKNYVSNQL